MGSSARMRHGPQRSEVAMASISARHPGTAEERATDGADLEISGQAGSIAFPDLVRAHYERERKIGKDDGATEKAWKDCLQMFQKQEGELRYAYWSKQRPSAVALTMKPRHGLAAFFEDDHDIIRLHR